MKKLNRILSRTALAALPGLALAMSPAAASGLPVFDATNYAQNLLQAARALDQINNQVKSLQNEATMIENMARNLKQIDFPELQRLNGSLQQIDRLMGEAKGIGFKVGSLEQEFGALFPDAGREGTSADRVASAKARLEAAMDDIRHSMKVQAEVVSNIRDDASLLNDLSERSQGATGSLEAQQAANQLLALSAKQQLQLQELMAAEFRSSATERARQSQAEAEARAATRRFLGSGKAYSPPGR